MLTEPLLSIWAGCGPRMRVFALLRKGASEIGLIDETFHYKLVRFSFLKLIFVSTTQPTPQDETSVKTRARTRSKGLLDISW